VNYLREMWTYDAHGNLTSDVCDTWHNSSWTPENVTCSIDDGAGSWQYKGSSLTFIYRIIAVTGIASENGNGPATYSLSQNYPNPFNPATSISFTLPSKSFVSLKIFDLLGREVATLVNEQKLAGIYTKKWNAANVSSGIYFYRLQADKFTETKKLLLLK